MLIFDTVKSRGSSIIIRVFLVSLEETASGDITSFKCKSTHDAYFLWQGL